MKSETEKEQKTTTFFNTFCILALLILFGFVVYIFSLPKWPTFDTEFIEIDVHRRHFKNYCIKFNKSYEGDEFERRFQIYKKTLKEIEKQNKPWDDPAHYGTNKFSDMTQEEFEQLMLMKIWPFGDCSNRYDPCFADDVLYLNISGPPAGKFDWRLQNVIGPVLDQNYCLSCWAFSIVGVMESMALISKLEEKYTPLSIQELTDCPDGYTFKCGGGNPELALLYLCNKRLPITKETWYPLTLVNQTCYSQKVPPQGFAIDNFTVRCNMSGYDIARQVLHGPVVAMVNSAPWKNYNGGIIRFHCSGETMNELNHVVQIVGFDLEDPVPHFIVRNSWGTDFGDQGYVKVAVDGFICGIGRQISFFNVRKVGSL